MQYLIQKVSLMVKTWLVDKRVAVLLHNQKLIWKVPILLYTEANEYKHSQEAVNKSLKKNDLAFSFFPNIFMKKMERPVLLNDLELSFPIAMATLVF